MSALVRRLAVLERARPVAPKRWHRLLRREQESDASAILAHEAERGPIGDAGVIIRVIVSVPGGRQM